MLPRLLIAVGLVAATGLVYADVASFGFVSLDDGKYVAGNPQVGQGLTAAGARWALTTDWTSNRIPLTWLSLMLDVELFGVNAAAHHAVNVALHAANAVLLFWILAGLTQRVGPSAFVAVVFAVHPLHVESVAWISERKDVLSGLFWLAALAAWCGWTRHRGALRYALALVLFAAGLAAKPSVVTFPFVLLLLDVWPLGRISWDDSVRPRALWPLVREKLPLFALSAAGSVATASVGAYFGSYTLAQRGANALVSYARYLGKTFWPTDLAVLYPHPGDWPVAAIAGAALLIVALCVVAVALRRRAPHVLVGWALFLGALVPALGLVQVGRQAMADRYMYLPLVGLACAIAYSVPREPRALARGAAAAGAAALLVLGVVAERQVAHWRSSEALFEHALAVTHDNWAIHYFHAENLLRAGRIDDALEHLAATVRIRPLHSKAHHLRGRALAGRGDESEALHAYDRAVASAPSNWPARLDRARVLDRRGQDARAAGDYRAVLALEPGSTLAARGLAWILVESGDAEEALALFGAVRSRLGYDDPVDLDGRAAAEARLGRLEDAARTARRAERIARDAGFEAQAAKSAARAGDYEARAATSR